MSLITITVLAPNGAPVELERARSTLVADVLLDARTAHLMANHINWGQMSLFLVYRGVPLDVGATLDECGIRNGARLNLHDRNVVAMGGGV